MLGKARSLAVSALGLATLVAMKLTNATRRDVDGNRIGDGTRYTRDATFFAQAHCGDLVEEYNAAVMNIPLTIMF